MKPLAFCLAVTSLLLLNGCGDAETIIIEKNSLETGTTPTDDDHTDDHSHDDEHNNEDMGRLFVINPESVEAQVFDLENNDLLTTALLDALPSAVYASGGYRFAALIERDADKVSFFDGGLWQEAHDDHFDVFRTMPMLSNHHLEGSRPTHFVANEGQVAVFFDGDASADRDDSTKKAAIQIVDDHVIADGEAPIVVNVDLPMHGVAEPRKEHLLATIRRDDSLSTSTNFILPDQVGVYHLHDDEYELEQTFDVACPDLHGAAQNEDHVVFGCGDGVFLATETAEDTYFAQKLLNPSFVLDGARIGRLWGHQESDIFIGSAATNGISQFFSINPDEAEIELIDWQPMPNAVPVFRGFAVDAELFVILDNQGYLTLIEPLEEDGHTHWEYGARLDISDADVSLMPEGMTFSMTFAQNAHIAYVADPISQQIVAVDLDIFDVIHQIELNYAPSMITWLGIVDEHTH